MTVFDESLTGLIARQLQRPIEKIVRTKARYHLLDWLGCVAGALKSDVACVQGRLQDAGATEKAAWLGNVLEMDDVHRSAILHPGPVIWPTVLNVGGDNLDEAVNAAVAGYEAMIAVGALFDGEHYTYWHNTATAGTFGAAAAAALRLGVKVPELVSAMGLAGSVTGGLWQMRHEPVMAKQWHLAHVMTTGIMAARNAKAGITGPRFILEGPQGLFAATCQAPTRFEATGGWRINEVSFKPWGACRHAHPAIDAALELKAKGALVGPVKVSTYRDALTFCDKQNPTSVIEAKFSIQHAIAIVMERGIPQLADFEPDAIAALANARAKVELVEDPAFTAAYPAHFGAAITSDHGKIALADTLGDPERPLSADGIVEKARSLMAWGGVEAGDAEEMIRIALQGDKVSDITRKLEKWL